MEPGGIVIRNSDGDLIATLCRPQLSVTQPILAELNVLWRALIFSLEIGITEVEFEGDALAVSREVKRSKAKYCLGYGWTSNRRYRVNV